MNTELKHGDAFQHLPELDDSSAHAAIVDYPWEFKIQTGSGDSEIRNREGRGLLSGCREPDHEDRMFDMATDDQFPELLDELSRILVPGAWAIFMADDRFQDMVRQSIRDSDLTLRRNWAWSPQSMGMGNYGRVDHYPIPVATNGDTGRYVTSRSTLYTIPKGRQTDYPTGKPVELYRQLLAPPVLESGERLLEPFCGSGPGAAVANERGLDYWGCDITSEAVEQTRERFAQQTLGGQVTFD